MIIVHSLARQVCSIEKEEKTIMEANLIFRHRNNAPVAVTTDNMHEDEYAAMLDPTLKKAE